MLNEPAVTLPDLLPAVEADAIAGEEDFGRSGLCHSAALGVGDKLKHQAALS
jgi:hypothetical protein